MDHGFRRATANLCPTVVSLRKRRGSSRTPTVAPEGLGKLDDRERRVIGAHFGLDNSGCGETLASIAKDYGVSKERLRQIKERALERLRFLLGGTAARDLLGAAEGRVVAVVGRRGVRHALNVRPSQGAL